MIQFFDVQTHTLSIFVSLKYAVSITMHTTAVRIAAIAPLQTPTNIVSGDFSRALATTYTAQGAMNAPLVNLIKLLTIPIVPIATQRETGPKYLRSVVATSAQAAVAYVSKELLKGRTSSTKVTQDVANNTPASFTAPVVADPTALAHDTTAKSTVADAAHSANRGAYVVTHDTSNAAPVARAIAHAMRYDNPLLAYAPKIDLAGASAVYSHGYCVSVPNTFAAVTSLD